MASACVNNVGISPETFSPYGWLTPRLSLTRDNDNTKIHKTDVHDKHSTLPPPPPPADLPETTLDPADFEFRLDDFPAAAMLTADKLFSGGKLVPLHLSAVKPSVNEEGEEEEDDDDEDLTPTERLKAAVKARRRVDVSVSGNDPYLFSPKAPRCSSRWRELLGLKKLYNASATTTINPNPNALSSSKLSNGNENRHKTTSISSSSMSSTKALKNFLHRSSKTYTSDSSSLVLPLLTAKDSSSSSESFESLSLSSARLSLSSSSSSGHDHDDLPRHSLDFPEKPSAISLRRNLSNSAAIRTVRPRLRQPSAAAVDGVRTGRSPVRGRESESSAAVGRGVSVDSPRMNSSGKIVFQSLERSSSSPSSFNNGGPPRYKQHRPMERSYSANVRVVAPVLNVPVCSLRVGFGQLFSSPQKRSESNSTNTKNHGKSQKNRPESNRVQSH